MFNITICEECFNYELGACNGCEFEQAKIEHEIGELVKNYNIKVRVENISQETITKINKAIETGVVKERQDKEGAFDLIVENGEVYLAFVKEMQQIVIDVEDNIKDFANHSARVNGTYAKLGATDKQINTLKMFVYKYKISVAISPSMTREEASTKITELYKAVEQGLLAKREETPVNCVVKNVNNVLKLVQKQVVKSSDEDEFVNDLERFLVTGRRSA